LYPHLTQPVPAMSTAQFEIDIEQGMPLGGLTIPAETPLFAQAEGGKAYRFRTAYPVTLWPLTVTDAALETTERYPFLDAYPKVLSVLRIRLSCQKTTFGALSCKSLRFFLNAEARTAYALYNLLGASVIGMCVRDADKKNPANPLVRLGATPRPMGLGSDEALLPLPHNVHPAYRLLMEYFLFPDKFLYFDCDLPGISEMQRSADLLILLSEVPRQLQVSAETFALGCTPIVNLFKKTSEPIRLSHLETEYRLVADKRDERITEIHTVESVSMYADPSATEVIAPFYSFTHPADSDQHQVFYHLRRAPTGRNDLPGTDLFLSFTDLRFTPRLPEVRTLYAHTLCTNRDLCNQLPGGALLQIEEAAPVKRIVCLRKPTPPIELPLGGRGLWMLISHLSLNHFSLTGGPDSLRALREILRLYRLSPTSSTEKQVMGIADMRVRPVMRQVGQDAWRGFCQGLEVTLELDEEQFVGSSALLLSAVLHRFFGLQTAVNSFVEVLTRTKQRQGVWKRWPALSGDKSLL
jgi:type VI secretion system protein ImpG